MAIGFVLGGSVSMSCFAAYWPETGRFEVFGGFSADPSLAVRGQKDEVGDRYVDMQRRGEIRTYPGKGMVLTARIQKTSESERSTTWYGRIERGGSVRLTVTKGRGASGHIDTSMGVYRVEPDKRGFSWLYRADY